MRHTIIALLAACTGVVANQASAQDWFVGVHAGVGYASFDNIDDDDTIGTGELIGGEIDGDVPDDDNDEAVANIGISLGREFGSWALEGDLSWRYRADWDLSIRTPSIDSITNVQTDVETTSMLLNLTRTVPLTERWSWLFGAGLGVALQDLDSKYVERAVPGVRDRRVFRDHEDSVEFSWNLQLGLVAELNENWSLHTRYRYIDLGDLKVGPFEARDAELSADYTAHELTFSLHRKLRFH